MIRRRHSAAPADLGQPSQDHRATREGQHATQMWPPAGSVTDNMNPNSVMRRDYIPRGSPRTPLFPMILFRILQEAEALGHDHIISWVPNGKAFEVYNRAEFISNVFPRYNPQQSNGSLKWKSFTRQLNLYGFERSRTKVMYSHKLFMRDNEAMCTLVVRTPASSKAKTGPAKRKSSSNEPEADSGLDSCNSGYLSSPSQPQQSIHPKQSQGVTSLDLLDESSEQDNTNHRRMGWTAEGPLGGDDSWFSADNDVTSTDMEPLGNELEEMILGNTEILNWLIESSVGQSHSGQLHPASNPQIMRETVRKLVKELEPQPVPINVFPL